MKKSFLIVFLPLFFSVFFSSCVDKKNEISTSTSQNSKSKNDPVKKTDDISYDELKTFFSPTFEAVVPEDSEESVKKSKKSQSKKAESKKSGGLSESVVPELRKLSDYKTSYVLGKKEFYKSSVQTENISDEKSDDASKEFFVESWGPKKIVSESENPTFYVEFSKPAHVLSALEEPSSTSEIMTITPEIKGVFRWYGTKHLAFEAQEPAEPSEKYTIQINKNLKSLDGSPLVNETTFNTQAEAIEITNLFAGFYKDGDSYEYYGDRDSGVIPEYANTFYVRLNYPVTAEKLEDILSVVSSRGTYFNFTIQPDYNENAFYWTSTRPKFDKDKQKSNSFIVTITDKLPFHSVVNVDLAYSNSKARTFRTLDYFSVEDVGSYTRHSENGKLNPLAVRFNIQPDLKSLVENTKFDFDFALTENNVSVDGNYAYFYNLPVSKREKHQIIFNDKIKDVYGQNLLVGKSNGTYEFEVSAPVSYSKFLNSGAKIMEAQFPHKIIFEYQNIEQPSKYWLESTKNPLDLSKRNLDDSRIENPGFTLIDPEKQDERHFTELDLNPYLKDGLGAVKFEAAIDREYYNSWEKKTYIVTDRNLQTIQVTDIGATVRLGANKLVALVTSMKTGKPIADAEVQMFTEFDEDSTPVATGKTDKNGLCVIDFTERKFNDLKRFVSDSYYNIPAVRIINKNDSMVFYPDSHNPYASGVDTSSLGNGLTEKQRTFIFVDRGLYKPGETVTFRGIDRTQRLGRILTHKGGFKIKVTDGSYYRPEIVVPEWSGDLSESGGFYGSFKLPDEIKPGSYCIEYSRAENGGRSGYASNARCYFTVAEFERLKIESSLEIPKMVYYGGDKLSAHLSADYLAGGALSNASYSVSWFRQPISFAPETLETDGFEFGPEDNYSSRDFYDEGKGQLDASGSADFSSNSEKISNGSAYQYRVEAAVTDVSNQRVSSAASVLVHPAEFYVGLKRSGNGFAKKGSKLEVNYILVNPDGTKITSTSKAKELNYSLSRTVWTVVNEKSVNRSVYTRYTRSEKEESSGKIDIKSEGKFSVDLPEAGWYTLKVSGRDRENRYVETDIGFYASGSGAAWRGSENSESINLTPSQSQYNPGDKAQILMESPLPAGDYLITVEREGIFTEEVRHFDESANVIEIPVSQNYVPVVYVSVSSYSVRHGQPTHEYGEPDLDKPKGYYGATALFVNPRIQAFSVEIACDKPSYKPGEQATITLTATKGGKPYSNAELTLLAVDRGVLDLINYHVPNPIDFFYSKDNFPLCVKGGDSRAYLLDPVTYSIKNLQGGDSDEEKEDERKDFRPTAVFEPVLITDENGQAKCTFTLPDNLTTYRITAFGVKDDIFALSEDEVQVQNPMNVQVVQPRRLRERDTAETGVLITNLDSKSQKVTVKAGVAPLTNEMAADINYVLDDGISVVPGNAFFDGKTEHSVTVQSGDSAVVYFDLAAQKQGVVQLTFEIQSEILNEKIKVPLKIEKTFTYETVTMIGTVGQDEKTAEEQLIIPEFSKEGEGNLKFTLDATRLGMLGGAVNYLFEYPYGCLEQQSSKVLPLVIFGEYIDVFGLDSEVSSPEKVVKQFVKSWGNYQKEDGGFPYWPSGKYSSYYVSTRIAHIYALALKRGYKPSDLKIDIQSLLKYLENESEKTPYLKAYSSYVLSLFDDEIAALTAKNALSDLNAKKDERTLTELSYMGLAYKNLGIAAKADEMAQIVKNYLQPSERSVSVIEKNKIRFWYMFESKTEEMALILQLLSVQNPADTMVDRLIFTLMQNQSKGYWQNTATTSHVLEAVYTYIKERNLDETNFTAKASLDGKEIMKEKFKGVDAKPKTLTLGFTDEQLAKLPRGKAIPVDFEKDGKGWLFYTAEMKYALPDEMLTSRDEGLKVSLEITDSDTKQVVNNTDGTAPVSLESGKLYKAKVRVESTKDRNFVALRAAIPSGAEILDSTFVTSGAEAEIETSGGWQHWLSNKTIYDNEIQFFWDEFETGAAEVTFTFRAARRGVYPTPPVTAECMYEPEIFGRNEGYLFTIK